MTYSVTEALRLIAGGGRIWLAPDIPVTYFPRRTPRALARQYWRYGEGRATTVRRHHRRLKLRQALPLAIAPAAALALAAPLHPVLDLPAAGWALLCQGGGLARAVGERGDDHASGVERGLLETGNRRARLGREEPPLARIAFRRILSPFAQVAVHAGRREVRRHRCPRRL